MSDTEDLVSGLADVVTLMRDRPRQRRPASPVRYPRLAEAIRRRGRFGDVAAAAGWSASLLSAVVHGNRRASEPMALALAQVLGVDVGEIPHNVHVDPPHD